MRKYIILFLLIVFVFETQAITRYVKPVSAGSGNGSSWANASDDLQEMINISSTGDQIWVAAGTYIPKRTANGYNNGPPTPTYPTTDGGQNNAFVLRAGVQIYGGFPNNGTATWTQRDWNANPTILSGDRGIPNNNADNCYHVVISTHVGMGNSVLDGFTITGGNGELVMGTNISVNGVLVNNTFGGGIYNSSSLSLSNVIIRDNMTYNGGGIKNTGTAGSLVLGNVLICDNMATNGGGGIACDGSFLTMYSTTISGNITLATSGGGIDISGTPTCSINNSIIWGNILGINIVSNISGHSSNTTFRNCLVGGEPILNGIILNGNPFFVNRANGNYRLTSCSPAIDMGEDTLVGTSVDLDGNPRIYNGIVDLGAYESQTIHTPPTMTARTTDTNICYRDTATISITSLVGTSPWQVIYTKNNELSYDTIKLTGNYNWKISPSDSTMYRFIALADANCIVELTDSIRIDVIKPRFSNNFLNDTLCSGDKTQPIVFAGLITSFEWKASGDTIANIPQGIRKDEHFGSYTVINTTPSSKTTTITVTPKYVGSGKNCVGKDTSFSIIVNPAPELDDIPEDDTLCSGETTKTIIFDTDIAFTCTVNGGVISGLPIGTQTGNFGEYTLENKTSTPLTALVKITSNKTTNCRIKDTNFSITVFPEPTVTNLKNDTLCDNETTKDIDFKGNGNVYEWTATAGVSGIPTGLQTGNFGKYTVTNKTANRTKSVITVFPKYMAENDKECDGPSQNFEIIVIPATIIESITLSTNSKTLCEGDNFKIETRAKGDDLMYQWYQNKNLLQGEQSKDFVVSSVSSVHSGEYYVEVTGTCGKKESQKIKVNAGGGDMLVEKWHDVILVNNFKEEYIGYQWYKDGRIIDRATNQFYQEIGGLNGCYSVELRLAAGGRTRSCERCAYKTGKSSDMAVYPNPTTGQLTINNEQLTIKSVEIFDVIGQVVGTWHAASLQSEIKIDISHLTNGMYFLRVDGKTVKVIKK